MPPSRLVLGLPRDIETITLKCLQKEPAKRYGSAESLADDLRRFLAGEPIRGRRRGAVERTCRWCRRKPVLAGLAVALAASLVVGFTGVAWQWRRAETKAKEARAKAELAETERTRADAAARHAEEEAARARFQTALTSFIQASSRAEQGDVAEGLLWMAEALDLTPNDHPELSALLRANLPAWEEQLVRMGPRVPYEEGTSLFGFSPDGKGVLTRLPDMVTLQIRDTVTGRAIGGPIVHEGLTTAVFSPDGRRILSGGQDHIARLWDAANGQPIGDPLRHEHIVASVAFSPDSKTVLTASHDKTARLWDAETGRPLAKPMMHEGPVYVGRFSPDGLVIVTGSLGLGAQLWNVQTGRPLGPPMSHPSAVYSVAFSPDGNLILTGSGSVQEGTAQLWDAATGQSLGPPVPHPGIVCLVEFSPDGTTCLTVSGDDQRLRLWDVATGRSLGEPVPLLGLFPYFSRDGRSLLVNDGDKGFPRILRLSARTLSARPPERQSGIRSPQVSALAASPGRYAYAAFSPDGTKVITHGTPRAQLWDVATGQPQGSPIRQRWAGTGPVVFSLDGSKVATASDNLVAGTWDCMIQVSDSTTGRLLVPPIQPIDTVKTLAFSPDGARLATGDFSDGVQLWDMSTGAPVGPRLPQANLILALAFSPDGKTLAVGTTNDRGKNNSQVRLWDLATNRPIGEPMRHRDSGTTTLVAFSPDGKTLLSVSHDGLAWRWDAITTRSLGPPIPHPTGFVSFVFHPDSRSVLTGTRDGTSRLWDLRTGKPLSPPVNRPSPITALAFRPDGAAFAAGYADGVTRLWDLATGKPIGPNLTHRGPVLAVAFSPDGQKLLSVDTTADIQPWTVPPPAADSTSQLRLRMQALTGMELRLDQSVALLDRPSWKERLHEALALSSPGELANEAAGSMIWHEMRARSAEASGQTFAALWHLGRLIAARPEDGTLLARRALVHAAAGDVGLADADLAQALRLGALDQCIDILTDRAQEAASSGRWDLTLWALNHAILVRPDEWTFYVDRAAIFDHLGRTSERDQDLKQAIDRGADSLYLVRRAREAESAGDQDRARSLRDLAIDRLEPLPNCHLLLELAADQLRRNQPRKAGEILDRIVSRREVTRADQFDGPLLWLHLGNPKLYHESCSKLLAAHAATRSPTTANAVAWQCVLGPDAVSDNSTVVRLANLALSGASAEERPRALTTLGAALYRAGHPLEAISKLEDASRLSEEPGLPQTWAFLAMSHRALGHSEAAHQWLRKLSDRLPPTYWEGVELVVLQREAETLILSGPDLPADSFAR